MSKSFKLIVCAVLIMSMLSGCVNTVHLKDLMIVEGMGIETSSGKINVIIQTLKLGAAAGSETPQGNRTYNTEENGSSIVDAVSRLSKSVSKKLFFGQNKLIVFSRDIAENDFEEKLDYFLRSSDSRIDVAVCMSDKDAKQIIESNENDSGVPCENIVHLLKNGEEAGLSAYVTMGDLINMASDKTSDVYLAVLDKNGDQDNVQTKGLGLFNSQKLAYVTNDDETMGFLLISNKVKACSIEFEDDELGSVSVKIFSPKAKKKVYVSNDGRIVFSVDIKAQLMVDEIEKGMITALNEKSLDNICREAEKELERLCTAAFFVCRDNGSDSIRVGEYLAKDCPELYHEISDDWDTHFKKTALSLSAHTSLKKISDNTQLD